MILNIRYTFLMLWIYFLKGGGINAENQLEQQSQSRALGDECSHDDDCDAGNSQCKENICKCKPGFTQGCKDPKNTCVPETTTMLVRHPYYDIPWKEELWEEDTDEYQQLATIVRSYISEAGIPFVKDILSIVFSKGDQNQVFVNARLRITNPEADFSPNNEELERHPRFLNGIDLGGLLAESANNLGQNIGTINPEINTNPKIGEACDDTKICSVDHTYCHQDYCECQGNYIDLPGNVERCHEAVEHNEPCEFDSQCEKLLEHAWCGLDTGLCECRFGYHYEDDECTLKTEYVTGKCRTDTDCHFVDVNSFCNSTTGICLCYTGYIPMHGVCVLTLQLGKDCIYNEQCSHNVLNSLCNPLNAKCECEALYQEENGTCVLIPPPIPAPAGNGKNCSSKSQCEDHDPNSHCNNQSLCACSEGYTYVLSQDACLLEKRLAEECLYNEQCTAVADFSFCNRDLSPRVCDCIEG